MLPPSASCVLLFAFLKHKVGLWKTISATVSFETLRRLRRAILTSGVVLIYDNARSHYAVVTQQLQEHLNGTCLIARHSPDLVPSDFHLFPELKNWLGDQSLQKIRRCKATLKAISHHWRERSSKRGSETWSTNMRNARIVTAIMSKSTHV
ncbi:hypothetical protein AVEN_231660-1 [Araneus ventricosus]|uniref:Tc1-like transposase DDE domain-containing protein n=1 Tax=Araneus ventricosus TaxID=182803 RepID=A0A4Y2R8S1_ARAVE|nr:hypothetical protein AVEN_184199-1 [Araneus ventricosus]GBN72171.1 hypothetical protein AVEN_231660-1 [Araneus ventricosus]